MKAQVYLLYFIFFLVAKLSSAQDYSYSNFLLSPLYLNPSLAGTSSGCNRFVMNYRNQYPAIQDAFEYLGASYDRYVPALNGGIGVMVQRGVEGAGFYKKDNISAIYSFHGIRTRKIRITAGLQTGLVFRSVDMSKLQFYDQIDEEFGFDPNLISEAQLPFNNNKAYLDATGGFSVIWKTGFIGVSVSHLGEPNIGLLSSSGVLKSKYSIHGSSRFRLNGDNIRKPTLIPAFSLNFQKNSPLFIIGTQLRYSIFNTGIWYRTGNVFDGGNAIVASLLFDTSNPNSGNGSISIGLSHDFTVGGPTYRNTGGAYEIGIIYTSRTCDGRKNKVTCPQFY